MKKPDIEKILSVNPDFVIASSATDSQIELYETLEKAGITVAYFDVSSFEDYLDMLNILTKINTSFYYTAKIIKLSLRI